MSLKDRFGRVTQRAKDVGAQVRQEAVGVKDDAAAAAQARVDAAKDAAAVKTGAVVDRASATKGRAADLVGSLRSGFDEEDIARFIARLPVPAAPVQEPWRFSLSKIITAGEKPPKGTGLLLKQLDRLGAIDIGPEEVGFDDATAKWPKVQTIRTRSLDGIIEMLAADTVSDTIGNFLPPVPGSGWVSEKAAAVVFTLYAMVSELALRDPEAGRHQYVCEVEYKGWVRTREAQTGFFTGPCMALVPGLDELFRTEAARHGVTVVAAEQPAFESAEKRAAWLREQQAVILARRERARKQIDH